MKWFFSELGMAKCVVQNIVRFTVGFRWMDLNNPYLWVGFGLGLGPAEATIFTAASSSADASPK